ncbi:MAG: response regulator [Phycisphaerales bacterium]|jgi:excisionase family DNA binding protein|nr:response regulator [Planctomycetota bacterium]
MDGSEQSLEHLRNKAIFTTGEAAEVCNVSQQTIIRCFDNGRLQGFRVPGSRFRRIPRADLIRFMRENEIPLGVLGDARRTALVVDDDAELSHRIDEAFRSDSMWQVITVPTALEAGVALERHEPDVAIFDAGMSEIDADRIFEMLRRDDRFGLVRVVFTGTVGDEERLRAARRCGAVVLRKPFELEQFRQILQNGAAA